jgi:hypothetical protein
LFVIFTAEIVEIAEEKLRKIFFFLSAASALSTVNAMFSDVRSSVDSGPPYARFSRSVFNAPPQAMT